jgi:hypothetical protein
MSSPIERTIHFKCPECSTVGFVAKMRGEDGWRSSKGFDFSIRDGYVVVVCDCGAKVLPEKNSN